ncbi:MAG TPA: hypothetical protein VFA52_04405 [Candidatus Paceibacterota bacterium]|jgi:hypothetical protein|nr:hypothetical protein [Candidatus Paceibacterota bacterium]
MLDSPEFIPIYNLDALSEQQRQDYIKAVCNYIGVPPELNLVMLAYIDEGDGPKRLVAYAKRGATEIIRNSRGINIINLTHDVVGGSIVFTATAKDSNGRQEISTGAKWIKDLSGKALDDAIMTAQTRACRRVTLQFVGAGILDESEINPSISVSSIETKFGEMSNFSQPTLAPNSEPAKATRHDDSEFERKTESKKRGRKPRIVDMESSSVSSPVPPIPPPSVPPPSVPKSNLKLSVEQVKPFRQRLFRIINDYLEPNGFLPKLGMGNSDKMRLFASSMFPEVENLSELTAEQWESFLSALENKIKSEGTESTIKYIESVVGL